MIIAATHPPCPETVDRYRRSGYWTTAQPVAAQHRALAAGGFLTALVDNDRRWTYQELADAVLTLRAALTQHEVGTGESVLVLGSLRNAAVAAYVATLHHGAVAVLLDRRCGRSDIENACRDAGPRLALAFDDDAHRVGLADYCQVLPLDHLSDVSSVSAINEVPIDPDLPAVVVFTSGTTGAPKGVIHTPNSLGCGRANMIAALRIRPQDVLYLSSPLASITGVLQIESALTEHATVILEEAFSAPSALDRVVEHRATVIGGAPIILDALFAEAERQGRDELPLRCIAVGGTMIPRRVICAAERFGIEAVRVYGSSEVPFSTATSLADGEATADDGATLPGVELAIRDSDGADELLVRGPHQFHGYLRSAHNADAFAGDWVRTGDQADIDGDRLKIKGRLKEIAVRKGMKISLAEIESAASGLGECVAYAVPDDETGERLALAIRTSPSAVVTYEGVVAHLSAVGLAKWKLPEQIVRWDMPFPRTASGKVIRRQLAEDGRQHPTVYAPRIADA